MDLTGELLIESINKSIDLQRIASNIIITNNRFLILKRSSDKMSMGGLIKHKWQVYYTYNTPICIIDITVVNQIPVDQYNKDLISSLQLQLCQIIQSDKWKNILYGKEV